MARERYYTGVEQGDTVIDALPSGDRNRRGGRADPRRLTHRLLHLKGCLIGSTRRLRCDRLIHKRKKQQQQQTTGDQQCQVMLPYGACAFQMIHYTFDYLYYHTCYR